MAAVELKRQTATVDCPKSMVGRVIGKNGETIKALQTYTGALIQIDQTVEPTKVTISGTPHSLSLAVSMVTDIVKGTFKGFALLRQVTNAGVRPPPAPPAMPMGMGMPAGPPAAQPRPVYAPGYGLIPPSQLYGADERTAGVVPVRPQAPLAWPQGGQVLPQQLILGLPQQGGMVRPMAGQQALLAGGMGVMGGMDEAAMMGAAMGGYGMAAPMYAAYQPADAAAYGAMPMGVMGGGPEMMYAPAGAPAGMAGGDGSGMPNVGGAAARMYGAAAAAGGAAGSGARPGGMMGAGKPGDMDPMGGGGGGNWVQIMDPEGKVFLVNQAGGPGGAQ